MNLLTDSLLNAEAQLHSKVKPLAANEADFGVLSTGERIAVPLVLDPHDLLQFA